MKKKIFKILIITIFMITNPFMNDFSYGEDKINKKEKLPGIEKITNGNRFERIHDQDYRLRPPFKKIFFYDGDIENPFTYEEEKKERLEKKKIKDEKNEKYEEKIDKDISQQFKFDELISEEIEFKKIKMEEYPIRTFEEIKNRIVESKSKLVR